MIHPLRIGTRGSMLALTQARMGLALLQKAFPGDPVIQNATLVPITTTGDRIKDRPLHEVGGKGLFAKELEQALEAHDIDCAIHSLKDMETTLRPGLIIGTFLAREDARDAFLSFKADSLATLPSGSRVGTCAPRRVAQILHHRPDLTCVPLRGNVDTRIRKLQEGHLDAIVLAVAGLRRLGREGEMTYIFSESEMLPAVSQGALAFECRENDYRTLEYLSALNHEPTQRCVTAERALLTGLGANCKTPVGGHATLIDHAKIRLEALIAKPEGTILHRTVQMGEDPVQLGMLTAKTLLDLSGHGFWSPS